MPPSASIQTLGLTVLAGLAGAAVDGAYFSVSAFLEGRSPVDVLHSIAGFWPIATSTGSSAHAVLGGATHVMLACFMATGYLAIWLFSHVARARWLSSGAVYGILLYGIMYLIVLPARWPEAYPRFDGWIRTALDALAHIGVGLAFSIVFASVLRPGGRVGFHNQSSSN